MPRSSPPITLPQGWPVCSLLREISPRLPWAAHMVKCPALCGHFLWLLSHMATQVWSKTTQIYISEFWRSEAQNWSHAAQIKVLAGLPSFQRLRGESVLAIFNFRRPLRSLAAGLLCCHSCSHMAGLCLGLCQHGHVPFSDSGPRPLLRTLWITQRIMVNSCLKILNFITPAKSLLLPRLKFSQVLGLGGGPRWGHTLLNAFPK